MKRAIVLSGGASKGAFTAGVVRYLLRKTDLDFQIAVGTSTGSLVAGPVLLRDHPYCFNVYRSVEDKDIFKNSLIGDIANFINKFVYWNFTVYFVQKRIVFILKCKIYFFYSLWFCEWALFSAWRG